MAAIPKQMMIDANRCHEIRGRVKECDHRDALMVGDVVAGFVTTKEQDGVWLHGPIYVAPEHRRKGLVMAYYMAHPERTCVAWLADSNTATVAMHTKAGFRPFRRGFRGAWYRREPLT